MFFPKCLVLVLIFQELGQIRGNEDDNNIWPDISCHPGKIMEDVVETVKYANLDCKTRATASPWMEGLDFSSGNCDKICVLEELSFVKYNEGYNGAFLSFQNDDNSLLLMAIGWDDVYSLKLVKKLKAECDELFYRIFYVEKHPCNSEEANQVYDCIQKAVTC